MPPTKSIEKSAHIPEGSPVPIRNKAAVKRRGPIFTDQQRELVLARVAELYLKAIGPSAIAKEIGVSTQQAINYVKMLERRWRESSMRDFDAARALELAKLDNLEMTYWDAWERSCQDATQTQTIVVPTLDADGHEKPTRKRQTIRKIENVGDARYLDGVFKCIDRRIKLMGLDAAERHIVEARAGAEDGLKQRLEKYAVVFGAAIIGDSQGHLGRDDPDESLDSQRSAPEAGGILDVSYEQR
jgi:hypothetical protein